MVGEQIVQFEFIEGTPTSGTTVTLSLVGDGHTVCDTCYGPDCGVVTNALIEQISTFGTHTESTEVEDGKAQ